MTKIGFNSLHRRVLTSSSAQGGATEVMIVRPERRSTKVRLAAGSLVGKGRPGT